MASAVTQADLAQMLSQVERRVTARLVRLLNDGGVSLEEWRVLSCLAGGPGRPMSEVADFAILPAPTLTKVVDRMVAANLVYRGVDSRDRRRVLVFLTSRGRTLHRRLARVIEDGQAELREACGAEALVELAQLLARVAQHLDGHATTSKRGPD